MEIVSFLYLVAIGLIVWFAVLFTTKFLKLTKDVSDIEYNLRVLIDKLDNSNNNN